MLAMVCLFTACSDDDDDSTGIVQYPLPERMQLSVADNEPVLVKNETEFNDLFGTYVSQLPKVDFNKYDLVYGQGGAEHGVVSFESITRFHMCVGQWLIFCPRTTRTK